MPTLTPTKATGGVTKLVPAIYAEPDRQITDADLASFMAGSELNGPFMAEMLSGMLAHERCGRHLYRSCEGRTLNPILQAKYREFGEETEQHVEILEQLITESGGNPSYVGPMARAVLGTDTNLVQSTFLLEGSLDLMTAETSMLDAVFLAESMDHTNWKLFTRLTETMPDGDLRSRYEAASRQVEPQEDEHLGWATQTKERLTLLQATSEAPAGSKADELIARVKNWLAD